MPAVTRDVLRAAPADSSATREVAAELKQTPAQFCAVFRSWGGGGYDYLIDAVDMLQAGQIV
jgi:hypothetical protein